MLRLISIPFSHYNERARWALDRFEVPYEESPFLPGLHYVGVWWHTLFRTKLGKSADRASSSYSTPVLLLEARKCLCDSGRIVRYVSDTYGDDNSTLYPVGVGVEDWEQLFHDKLGPDSRRLAYFHVMQNQEVMFHVAEQNVSPRQARIFRKAFDRIRPKMFAALKINAEACARSMDTIRKTLAAVDEVLSDGRRFLAGERFSAADLALASLASPVMGVGRKDGFSAVLPDASAFSPEFASFVEECRETRAGQHILRMYREERGTRQIPYRYFSSPLEATASST